MVPDRDDPGCRKTSELKLAGFLARSSVNGPGIRAVVWVQGCPIRCSGCFNSRLLSFSGGRTVQPGDLAEKILALDNIDGVTFSGGEPFAQAAPLAELGTLLRSSGLSVVTFTGFTWDQIISKDRRSWRRLLSVTDLLIAGPFVNRTVMTMDSSPAHTGKRGIWLCEGEPANGPDICEPADYTVCTEIEFTIRRDGQTIVTGFPGHRLVTELAANSEVQL